MNEPISISDPDGLLARHNIHKFASRAVSNNVIPLSRISPIALGLLNYIPLPNQTGSCPSGVTLGCSARNFQFTTTVPSNTSAVGLRLGQSFGRKDWLALNFQMQDRGGLILLR